MGRGLFFGGEGRGGEGGGVPPFVTVRRCAYFEWFPSWRLILLAICSLVSLQPPGDPESKIGYPEETREHVGPMLLELLFRGDKRGHVYKGYCWGSSRGSTIFHWVGQRRHDGSRGG